MTALRCAPEGAPATDVVIDVAAAASLRQRLQDPAWAGARPFLLVDRNVFAAHGSRLPAEWPRLELPGGEGCKTFATLEVTLRELARRGAGRRTVLVVAGGGATGDVGGLAASLYVRGVPLVHVPTTLLAMVDSSVGGKNAIDLLEGKNLVGTIHPPSLVLIDLAFLRTLPERELRSGLGETLKAAIGMSAELFALLEARRDEVRGRDDRVLSRVVELALRAKIRIVEADLTERGERRLLNLGHTLGHALEAHSGWTLPHGVAVAHGIWCALDVARALGVIAVGDAARCEALLAQYGYEREPLPPLAELLPFVRRDKKVEGDAVHMALPTGVGSSRVVPVPLSRLAALLQ